MARIEAEPLLTPAEVATMFRVDPKTVTRWSRAGKLTSVRTLGGHRRYREAEARALLAGDSVSLLWPSTVRGTAATARNLLMAAGVVTVSGLTSHTAADLKDLGLRPAHIDAVRLVLHQKRLALRGEVIDKAA